MPAVYKITNVQSNQMYVGSTINIEQRKTQHFSSLRNNSHHCVFLQRAFNKYKEDNFVFEVVALFESEDTCREFEQLVLDEAYDSLYNTSKTAGGGDLISYHPDKEAIIQKRTVTQKNRTDNMTAEERKTFYGKFGRDNGMFGKNHSEETKKLMSEIGTQRYLKNGHALKDKTFEEIYGEDKALKLRGNLSELASKRTGDKNPFYGKTHSEETKKKMSEYRKANPLKANSRKVNVEGTVYSSCTEAAEAIGVSRSLIAYRVKSDKYNYSYC